MASEYDSSSDSDSKVELLKKYYFPLRSVGADGEMKIVAIDGELYTVLVVNRPPDANTIHDPRVDLRAFNFIVYTSGENVWIWLSSHAPQGVADRLTARLGSEMHDSMTAYKAPAEPLWDSELSPDIVEAVMTKPILRNTAGAICYIDALFEIAAPMSCDQVRALARCLARPASRKCIIGALIVWTARDSSILITRSPAHVSRVTVSSGGFSATVTRDD